MPAQAPAPVPHGRRLAEKKKLQTKVKALASRQEGGFVLVEGQAGMGKTALLRDLENLGMIDGIRVLKGSFSAIDETTPLRVLSFVKRQLEEEEEPQRWPPMHVLWAANARALPNVGRQCTLDQEMQRAEMQRWLSSPLLAPMLGHDIAPNGPTVRLSPDKRQERMLALCVEIMRRAYKGHSKMLLLDNVQWMDEVSWKLVRMLHRDVRELLIVACIRSEGPPDVGTALSWRPTPGCARMPSSLPHAASWLQGPSSRRRRASHTVVPRLTPRRLYDRRGS